MRDLCAANASKRQICIRPVHSTTEPRCGMHEWQDSPPRDGIRVFAHAAFPALRAHAARNRYDRVGLGAAFRTAETNPNQRQFECRLRPMKHSWLAPASNSRNPPKLTEPVPTLHLGKPLFQRLWMAFRLSFQLRHMLPSEAPEVL
jgi:hypothetical protein